MAVVDAGSDVVHEWKVDGEVKSDKAYFDTFDLPEAKVYTVAYAGTNAAGTFRKSFEVQATERPLEIGFSPADTDLVVDFGKTVVFRADVRFGGSGLVHEWTVDGLVVGSEAEYSYDCSAEGNYIVGYKGVNDKQETVTYTWNVRVNPETISGLLFADMEQGTYPTEMFSTPNAPGLSVEDNPDALGKNQSAKVLQQKISGSHATKGYFVLKLSSIPELSKYRGIRFKYLSFERRRVLSDARYYYAGRQTSLEIAAPQTSIDLWRMGDSRIQTILRGYMLRRWIFVLCVILPETRWRLERVLCGSMISNFSNNPKCE